jgi:hypothetical protein
MSVDALTMAQFLTSNRNPQNYAQIEQLGRGNTSLLSAEELRNQLNLFGDTSQDTAILSYAIAATQYVSDYLGFPLCATTYRVYYPPQIVVGNVAYLDIPTWTEETGGPPIQLSFTVNYYDVNNNLATYNTYIWDAGGQRLILQAIPQLSQTMAYPWVVTVTLNTGWHGNTEVIKQAVKLVATHFYNNRSETVSGIINPSVKITLGLDALLRPFKPLVM